MRQSANPEGRTNDRKKSHPGATISEMAREPLLTTAEAAQFLRKSASSLHNERCRGAGPRFVKLGRSVRYQQADLVAYIAANVRRSTSETTTIKGASK